MDWVYFATHSDEELKASVAEAQEALQTGVVQCLPSSVSDTSSFDVEVRTNVVILTEAELARETSKPKLPKYMKSVPTLTLRKPTANGQVEEETVYAFCDPSQPFRTASLVQRHGVSCGQQRLGKQVWANQGQSLFSSIASKIGEENKLVHERKGLLSLTEWLDERGLGSPQRRRRGSRTSGGSDNRGKESESEHEENVVGVVNSESQQRAALQAIEDSRATRGHRFAVFKNFVPSLCSHAKFKVTTALCHCSLHHSQHPHPLCPYRSTSFSLQGR